MSPIAEVLHRAADLYLWDGTSASSGTAAWHGGAWVPDGKVEFSCRAVDAACEDLQVDPTTVHKMLAAMGCRYGDPRQYSSLLSNAERQARRYQWLKFAAEVAG